jgi:hypothetical protein
MPYWNNKLKTLRKEVNRKYIKWSKVQRPRGRHNQTYSEYKDLLLSILRFDNIVTFKLATFADRLSNDLSNVPELFRDHQYQMFTITIQDCQPEIISIDQILELI